MGLFFAAPLAGCDDWEQPESTNPYKFQSTRPLRGATGERGDQIASDPHFNPHAPCGARLHARRRPFRPRKISIHAPLAGRDNKARRLRRAVAISIHAPLAGRDRVVDQLLHRIAHFNPRAPCGARPHSPASRSVSCRFQSTRPLRGATPASCRSAPAYHHFNPRAPCGARRSETALCWSYRYFNPRAPCGARPCFYFPSVWDTMISIHAPLAGRDVCSCDPVVVQSKFQSTRPLRGATANLTNSYPQICAKATKGIC